MSKKAVIDLGTNTFHLLITDAKNDGTFVQIHRERHFVKLGENGVAEIGPAPYQRGINTLSAFKRILDENEVRQVRVFGTAALRTAVNGADFVREVKQKIDLDISLISGDEEARLICLGVRQAVPFSEEKVMIMDIGGGSVEFIIADEKDIFYAQSFPIGVSVLRSEFHKTEPVAPSEIHALQIHLTKVLHPLDEALKKYPVRNLIGASGTFDVLENLLEKEEENNLYSVLNSENFYPLYRRLLTTRLDQRMHMPGLPPDRADMIIVALILIDYILKLARIEKITVSAYAMKEGMLAEMQ